MRTTDMTYDEFRARAVRAAMAVMTEGVVFSETSRDPLDKDWERLTPETQKHWTDLSDLLVNVICPGGLTNVTPSDTTKHH